MGFQSGVIQFRGKLGQTIGRRNGNRSVTTVVTRNMNIIGVAAEKVSNPKTAGQASQRMKMRAAVNFYREIGFVLNHSWQGTPYRAASRNNFMQKALGNVASVIPFLKKGDDRFIPGNYHISTGSLVGAEVTDITDNVCTTSLVASLAGANTLGDLSTSLIESNGGLVNGDKLTFLVAQMTTTQDGESAVSQDDMYFKAVSLQLVLNTSDTTLLQDFADQNHITFTVADGKLCFEVTDIAGTTEAAAVIQSRVPAEGTTAWQRSNSKFYLSDIILTNFMSADQYNIALASYQSDAANINSDWYLNYGTFRGEGLSTGAAQQWSLFNIARFVISGAGADGADWIRSNVAAISDNGVVKILVKNTQETGNATYTALSSSSVQEVATGLGSFTTKLSAQGIEFITILEAQNRFGITIDADTPSEDTP